MYKIIYNREVLDTADSLEEAKYMIAEYNYAFKEEGAVRYEKI